MDIVLNRLEWEVLMSVWNKEVVTYNVWERPSLKDFAIETLKKFGLVKGVKHHRHKWESTVAFTRAGRAYVASFMKSKKVSKKQQEG